MNGSDGTLGPCKRERSWPTLSAATYATKLLLTRLAELSALIVALCSGARMFSSAKVEKDLDYSWNNGDRDKDR